MTVKTMRRWAPSAMVLCMTAFTAAQAAVNDGVAGEARMASPPLARSAPDEMEKVFKDHPEKFSTEVVAAYRARRIVEGMDPYLASKAGGAFQYRVDPDHKWSPATDPLRIIFAQAMHPDDSKIWMTFENSTQFPERGLVRFAATVEHGVVTRIAPVGKNAVGQSQ